MQSVGSSRPRTKSPRTSLLDETSNGKFGINFYRDVPSLELDLDTFETYALKRLKVLRKLEQLKTFKLTRDDLLVKMKQVLDAEELTGIADDTSHFILQLSYCQTEDLRRWFLVHECELLRIRLQLLPKDHLATLVQSYLGLAPIADTQKKELRPFLLLQKTTTTRSSYQHGMLMSAQEFESVDFFAVPFTQALDLVARRECYLHQGKAYISQTKAESLLLSQFRAQLSRQLAQLQFQAPLDTKLQHDAEGARVYPLLKNLSTCLVHQELAGNADYTTGEALTAATVPSEVQHMPLCMQEMHKGMKRNGKLRHFGRLQYGLFLKGAGLDLENALLFFQRHFTAVTGEQFQKEYAYNIRYNYGKEGKRQSRTAYSCNGLIHGNAPANRGDFHGCPYKHYDAEHLSTLLSGLNFQDRKDILALKQQGQFGLACHKQFVAQHPKALEFGDVPMDNIGNHPNAWFRASRAYHKAVAGGEDTAKSPAAKATTSPSGSPSDMQVDGATAVSPS